MALALSSAPGSGGKSLTENDNLDLETMDSNFVDSSLPAGRGFDADQVPAYYRSKTEEILLKYGPGPRVHFHMGLFGKNSEHGTSVPQNMLRAGIVDSQEAIISHAARSWGISGDSQLRLLDIGCGVGGGSLYWAQEHQAHVTALTIAAGHISIIEDFARQAGVSGRVTPVVGDIHDWNARTRFDGAYANESSGYMDRHRLFRVVADALKPGGWSASRIISSAARRRQGSSTGTTRRGWALSRSTSAPQNPPDSSWNGTRTSPTGSRSSGYIP